MGREQCSYPAVSDSDKEGIVSSGGRGNSTFDLNTCSEQAIKRD